ncbi:MAG: right-handed parallel beta-helix repeat-containing protein, partial [Planctomycetota bacterium]
MMLYVIIASLALCLYAGGRSFAADLYVAPGGSDDNPGSKDKPLGTLAGARDAVRKLKKQKPGRDIVVEFAGGTYRLNETVIFDLLDSAPPGHTITYRARAGERPVFSAGVPITGWRKLKEHPKDLPAEARGKLYVADLPQGIDGFYTLYRGATRLPRARCEGFTPPEKVEAWRGDDHNTLHFPRGAMRKWENLRDAEICIVGSAPWTMNVLPLESVDIRNRVARTSMRGTYLLTRPRFGNFPDGSVFVENVFAALNSPGEWLVDSRARKVYLWPLKSTPGRNILAPKLTEFIRVEGKIDYEGPEDTPVRGIVFRGLTFTHGERYTWQAGRRGWGLQHDWEMFDKPSAMVRFRGAGDCAV